MSSLFNSASKLFTLQPNKNAFNQNNDIHRVKVVETNPVDEAEAEYTSILSARDSFSKPPASDFEISSDPSVELIPQKVIDALGRDNELLRNRCTDLVRRIEDVTTLNRDVSQIFGQVNHIMVDLERTKSELSQRNLHLINEREAHQELRAQARKTINEHEQLKEDHVLLQGNYQQHQLLIAELEGRVGNLQSEFSEKSRSLAEIQRQSAIDRDKLSILAAEANALRNEMVRADKLIDTLRVDLGVERDRATLAEEDKKTLEAMLNDTRLVNARISRSLDEVKNLGESQRSKIEELEGLLAAERGEHGKVRRIWRQESEQHKADAAALEIKIESQAARIEATDKLLAAARNQHYAKVEELRKEERKWLDTQAMLASWEQKYVKLEQDSEFMRQQINEFGGMKADFDRCIEELHKTIKIKESNIAQLETKLHMQNERHSLEAQRLESVRERLEQRLAKLTDQFEREKLDRTLAQGALDVARKDRRKVANNVLPLNNHLPPSVVVLENASAAVTDEEEVEESKVVISRMGA